MAHARLWEISLTITFAIIKLLGYNIILWFQSYITRSIPKEALSLPYYLKYHTKLTND